MKHAPTVAQNLEKKLASLPKTNFSFSSFTDVKYYKGGFEQKMSRREASLILGHEEEPVI
jgi:DnaJ family protein C protein 19